MNDNKIREDVVKLILHPDIVFLKHFDSHVDKFMALIKRESDKARLEAIQLVEDRTAIWPGDPHYAYNEPFYTITKSELDELKAELSEGEKS